MSAATAQPLVSNIETALLRELEPELLQRIPSLEDILQSRPSKHWKFILRKRKYFWDVVRSYYTRDWKGSEPQTREDLRQHLIEKLSSELSSRLSQGIVNLTVESIRRESQPRLKETDERVVAHFEFSESLEEAADLVISYDGEVIKKFRLTLQVEASLVVKRVILMVRRAPSLGIQSLDFQDAKAELNFSTNRGLHLAKVEVPLLGEMNL